MFTFEICDFTNPAHLNALVDLLQEYMADPMGEHAPHTKLQQLRLVDGLANHEKSFVLFAINNDRAIGLATCFELFSTFQVKPFINIHDFAVSPEYRRRGVGRAMMQQVVKIAKEKGCCKVTLEVRTDNPAAQALYREEGFSEANPDMLFWVNQF